MGAGRDFEDLYAGGGVANPVQGSPMTGFGLTAEQKAALAALPDVDAEESTEGDRAQALEDLVKAFKQ